MYRDIEDSRVFIEGKWVLSGKERLGEMILQHLEERRRLGVQMASGYWIEHSVRSLAGSKSYFKRGE